MVNLIPLAIHCPHLELLDLRFDAREIQAMPVDFKLPSRTRDHPVTLNPAGSPISNPLEVAAFLRGLFGEVYVKVGFWSVRSLDHSSWAQVQHIIETGTWATQRDSDVRTTKLRRKSVTRQGKSPCSVVERSRSYESVL